LIKGKLFDLTKFQQTAKQRCGCDSEEKQEAVPKFTTQKHANYNFECIFLRVNILSLWKIMKPGPFLKLRLSVATHNKKYHYFHKLLGAVLFTYTWNYQVKLIQIKCFFRFILQDLKMICWNSNVPLKSLFKLMNWVLS